MPGPRRHRKLALWVFVVLTIVGVLLAFAQDQQTLRIESAHAADDPLFPGYVSALLGGHRDRRQQLYRADQRRPDLSLDARRRERARSDASASRPTSTTRGRSASSSPTPSSPRRNAASWSSWSSTPWAPTRSRRNGGTSLKAAGVKIGEFGAGEVVFARGAELPHAPEDPRRRRPRRVHRRRRPRRPVARATPRTTSTGATRWSASKAPSSG